MNKLVIIGNGFDLAHGLNTRYSDMINFFWDKVFTKANELNDTKEPGIYEDGLLKITLERHTDNDFMQIKTSRGIKEAEKILSYYQLCRIKSDFFQNILDIQNINNWVDVENEYYDFLLKELYYEKNTRGSSNVMKLNQELGFVKNLLADHLLYEQSKEINTIESIYDKIITNNEWRSVISGGRSRIPILRTLIVNFNYTNTFEKLYLNNLKDYHKKFPNRAIDHIHIHGDINDLENNPMIFGYGDELDKNSKDLVEMKGSEFFKNIKSLNYQSTSHYKNILRFIDENKFEVVILGHSCGNSDRTLLNTIFEHENCTTIKPYYHKWDGGDNYFDIVCNIYRNFTKNASFREKVIEKNLCETLT